MKYRHWLLFGALVLLGLAYVVYFTEWLNPAPIEIISQVRFSAQAPNFGHKSVEKKTSKEAKPAKPGAGSRTNRVTLPTNLVEAIRIATNFFPRTNVVGNGGGKRSVRTNAPPRGDRPPSTMPSVSSLAYATAGAVANVTFSMDDKFELTKLRVEDLPADGSKPKIMWQLTGKSPLLSVFLYGRDLEGMKPVAQGVLAEPLEAGVPYRIIVEAGRRRGTNCFTTGLVPQ
jgi:hypothetical protein